MSMASGLRHPPWADSQIKLVNKKQLLTLELLLSASSRVWPLRRAKP